MEKLLNELNEFKNLLDANKNVDWHENDPNREFETLLTQLQSIIDNNTLSDTDKMRIKLGQYICDDEDRYANMNEALALLVKQSEIDGSVMADDIVMMWQPLEYSLTVDELLEQIS